MQWLKISFFALLATYSLAAHTLEPSEASPSAAAQMPVQSTIMSTAYTPIKVEIVEHNGKYRLLRGGKPYTVKGAGIDHVDLETFAAHGGNSLRTWAVDDGAEPPRQLLDRAHALGLTVSLCLEFGLERMGFDYNDADAVARQAAETKARVLAHKDHPALLTWIVGNELNNEYTNPKVYNAVNDIAKMIHEIDPNHPVTTTISQFNTGILKDIEQRAPDLDFLSVQLYADIVNLPKYIKEFGYNGPYFVTEWGSVGHWEAWKTLWGAPVEQTSSEKAANYAKSYLTALQPYADQAIGNYVFLWGQKQERTPTWYGMFTQNGESTEAVDVMHYIWTGQWPENRAPRISPISLKGKVAFDNVKLWPGKKYPAKVNVTDHEGDTISYHWEVREESTTKNIGGDYEAVPDLVSGLIEVADQKEITLTAPKKSGAYRLLVYAYDGNGHAAHANIPFYVK